MFRKNRNKLKIPDLLKKTTPTALKNKVDIAIIAAMPEELIYLSEEFSKCKSTLIIYDELEFNIYEYKNAKILVAYTGMGTTFAASVLTLLYAYFHPEYVFLLGTAGGIKQGLQLRDVVIVASAFETEIQGTFAALKDTPFESCLIHPLKKKLFPSIYPANPYLLDIVHSLNIVNDNIHIGTVASSNIFPAPQELFAKIKDLGPYSIDMETSALYQISWLLNIKALAIRGISNILTQDGTDEHIHESDIKGSSSAATKVLLTILNQVLSLKYNLDTGQKNLDSDVAELIKYYNLKPHPEGGYFSQMYKSSDMVKSTDTNRYDDEIRSAGTSIYYLLNGSDFSAWHRIKSDELWHFYKGSALYIHVIDALGKLTTHLLGDPFNTENATFQVCVKAGDWFAAENKDKQSYSLVGCTVSPGFEYGDFELADKETLINQFPEHESIIEKLAPVSNCEAEQYRSKIQLP